MNTPNIDVLLADITFRRGWLAKMLDVTVHNGDDTQFASVSLTDLIDEIRALREERDEAVVMLGWTKELSLWQAAAAANQEIGNLRAELAALKTQLAAAQEDA